MVRFHEENNFSGPLLCLLFFLNIILFARFVCLGINSLKLKYIYGFHLRNMTNSISGDIHVKQNRIELKYFRQNLQKIQPNLKSTKISAHLYKKKEQMTRHVVHHEKNVHHFISLHKIPFIKIIS